MTNREGKAQRILYSVKMCNTSMSSRFTLSATTVALKQRINVRWYVNFSLLFDSGPYDSGPTIQAARFRPDTVQAEQDSGRKFWLRFRPDSIQADHDSGPVCTIQVKKTRFRPVTIQAGHDSGRARFRSSTIQAHIMSTEPHLV